MPHCQDCRPCSWGRVRWIPCNLATLCQSSGRSERLAVRVRSAMLDTCGTWGQCDWWEVRPLSTESRLQALEQAGLIHPRPEAITAKLFSADPSFFLASDKVQVKYEMLRAVAVDGMTVVAAAAAHGYSRAEFYLVQAAFAERGMAGLVDERRGRKGPIKITSEIAEYLRQAPAEQSGAMLAADVQKRFGVSLHRRTVERARRA